MDANIKVKGYVPFLVQENLLPVTTFAAAQGTDWVLTRDIGTLGKGTIFRSKDDLIARVDQALSEQIAQTGALKVA